MPRLIWTPEALADVQRLWRFLATKSVDAAGRAAHAIREGARTIAIQPEAGRPMADMEPEFREWPVPFGDSGYVSYHGTLSMEELMMEDPAEQGFQMGGIE